MRAFTGCAARATGRIERRRTGWRIGGFRKDGRATGFGAGLARGFFAFREGGAFFVFLIFAGFFGGLRLAICPAALSPKP